jgi:hypothetical protein
MHWDSVQWGEKGTSNGKGMCTKIILCRPLRGKRRSVWSSKDTGHGRSAYRKQGLFFSKTNTGDNSKGLCLFYLFVYLKSNIREYFAGVKVRRSNKLVLWSLIHVFNRGERVYPARSMRKMPMFAAVTSTHIVIQHPRTVMKKCSESSLSFLCNKHKQKRRVVEGWERGERTGENGVALGSSLLCLTTSHRFLHPLTHQHC